MFPIGKWATRCSTGELEEAPLIGQSGRCWIAFIVWWGAVRLSWQSLHTAAELSPEQALFHLVVFLLLSLAGSALLALFSFQRKHRLCQWIGVCVLSFVLVLCVLLMMHIMFYPEFVIGGVVGMVIAAAGFAALTTRTLKGLQSDDGRQ